LWSAGAHRILGENRKHGEWFDVEESDAINAIEVSAWIVEDCINRGPSRKDKLPFPRRAPGEGDAVDDFLSELIDFAIGHSIDATELFHAWEAWCSSRDISAGSQAALAAR
jgi:hypothetical protein